MHVPSSVLIKSGAGNRKEGDRKPEMKIYTSLIWLTNADHHAVVYNKYMSHICSVGRNQYLT